MHRDQPDKAVSIGLSLRLIPQIGHYTVEDISLFQLVSFEVALNDLSKAPDVVFRQRLQQILAYEFFNIFIRLNDIITFILRVELKAVGLYAELPHGIGPGAYGPL